jgi:hypothetical protein
MTLRESRKYTYVCVCIYTHKLSLSNTRIPVSQKSSVPCKVNVLGYVLGKVTYMNLHILKYVLCKVTSTCICAISMFSCMCSVQIQTLTCKVTHTGICAL